MSNLLTTGQVIDQLKPDETAEAVGYPYLQLQYRDIGLVYIDEEGLTDRDKGVNGHFFINGDFTKNLKWRILPKYVSFDDAMKALKEGKAVYFEGDYEFHDQIVSDDANNAKLGFTNLKRHSLMDLIEGKWTVED